MENTNTIKTMKLNLTTVYSAIDALENDPVYNDAINEAFINDLMTMFDGIALVSSSVWNKLPSEYNQLLSSMVFDSKNQGLYSIFLAYYLSNKDTFSKDSKIGYLTK